MNKHSVVDSLGRIDDDMIQSVEALRRKKKRPAWTRWGALAACLCLVLVGALGMLRGSQANTLQRWNHGYQAEEYFKFCNAAEGTASHSASLDASSIPYDETRYFSDMRNALEENGVIPIIQTHPQFTLAAHYKDGSLYCVELLWCRRSTSGQKEYSDLKVIAGSEEIPLLSDCIGVEVDESGNVLEPAVTVTERDGISIVARGSEKAEKTLTFQTEHGWYQISGSWNDSYASVVALFDWFWENPMDFEAFPMADGDEYTHSSLSEAPAAFADSLPDFLSFGFIEETTDVTLKNGDPVRFEGHYVAHADEELVKSQDYDDVEGHTKMLWCIAAEPDVYELDGCLGDISTLTREQVFHILKKEDDKVKFLQDDLLVTVYPDDAAEAWALIESLLSG